MATMFSNQIRLEILKMLKHRNFGHLGGSLSLVETLSVLYDGVMHIDPKHPEDPNRDYFILSKGHAGPALYATLALKGYFDKSLLNTLNDNGTTLPSHTDKNLTTGVDMTTGSLGQGLSVAVGVSLGFKLQNKKNRVYAVVGDGELNEGQCYEAFIFAGQKKLDNLIVFIDDNKLQLDGFRKEVSDQGDFVKRLESFDFYAVRVDGHDEIEITKAIKDAWQIKDKPTAIILDTIKGKGVKEFENIASNHHMRFSETQHQILDRVILELEAEIND
ncbi:MAG: transketolase [Candidatus Izemoplasmatales bacterium]|jgi:transketolase|nr:transketolase [Candidatus Izemoplasmatales bacterium]